MATFLVDFYDEVEEDVEEEWIDSAVKKEEAMQIKAEEEVKEEEFELDFYELNADQNPDSTPEASATPLPLHHVEKLHNAEGEAEWFECDKEIQVDLLELNADQTPDWTQVAAPTPLHLDRVDKSNNDQHEAKRLEGEKCDYKSKESYKIDKGPTAFEAEWLRFLRKDGLEQPNEAKWFKCVKCAYKCKQEECMRLHVSKHLSKGESKWFKCDKCEYKTKLKHNLKSHKNYRHVSEQIKVRKLQIVTKLASPKNIGWFKCGICERKFKGLYSTQEHMIGEHQNENKIA